MNDTHKETILIIDDDESVRKGLSFYLEDYGYGILTAENGRIAVDLFDRQNADLVLVDLDMPEMNGLEVLKLLTRKSPHTPLIVITGAQKISDAITAMRHGAWDYLVKPIDDASKLTDAIESGLSKARVKKKQFDKDVQKALDGLKMLKGIIPICSYCKKIRDSEDTWEEVDVYITKNSQAIFSHGICPACMKKNFSDLFD